MRRLGVPFIIFAIVAILYWIVTHDAAGLVSALPPATRDDVPTIAGVVFWLAAAWAVSSLLSTVILRYARAGGTQNKLPKLLIDLGGVVVFFIAVLIIISQVFGRSLTGLLATSGVFAAVIGFAVQKTISNMIAGIALNVGQGGIKLGDWIETSGGHVGQATEITWRITHLVTIDGRSILVPNSQLVENTFTNYNTPQRYFRVAKTVSVDYGAPAERIVLILQTAMEATEGVLANPKPIVLIDELADSGIVYSMNFWVPDYPESFPIGRQVVVNSLKFLDQAGYSPTYPKRDITVFEVTPRQIDRKVDVDAILHRVALFRSFTEKAIKELEGNIALQEFQPGAEIVREGDAGASLFIVVAGLLDVLKQTQGAVVRKVGRLEPGDVFGEMSLLTGAARSATIIAASATTLLEISKTQLEPILTSHPEIIAELSQLEAERLAANVSALALSPAERQEIAAVGVAAFLRRKIASFFGGEA
jgi:small-conductance mechanosensitive channel/CRP-like cAMP-binding protein